MKTFSTLFWVMCSLTMVNAAQAAAPTVLYDNFTAALINPAKWVGGESDAAGANLENLRHIVGNATLGNRLHLYICPWRWRHWI